MKKESIIFTCRKYQLLGETPASHCAYSTQTAASSSSLTITHLKLTVIIQSEVIGFLNV